MLKRLGSRWVLKLNSVIIGSEHRIIKKSYGDLISFTKVMHLVNSRGIVYVVDFYFGKNI